LKRKRVNKAKNEEKEENKKEEEEKIEENKKEKDKEKEGYYIPYFLVDDSITKICSIFREGNNLIADIERTKDGKIVRERMRTKDIKENNPWILLNYYESRIKFGL